MVASVDVRYYYDELPDWAELVSDLPTGTPYLAGRATGSTGGVIVPTRKL